MHDVGDLIPLHYTVVDPRTQSKTSATVAATLEDPDGVSSTLTVTEGATGEYSATFTPAAAGRYVVRWQSTGAVNSAFSDVVNVAEGASTALISLAEARAHLNLPAGEHLEDEELRGFITAATAAVERHLGQVVARRTITEQYDTVATRKLFLRHAPVLSVTSVASADGQITWDPDELLLDAEAGVLDANGGTVFYGPLRVTYVAGWRIVPPHVVLAAQIIVAHLWQTQRVGSLGQAPGFAGDGTVESVSTGFALPYRALELLGDRPPVIA